MMLTKHTVLRNREAISTKHYNYNEAKITKMDKTVKGVMTFIRSNKVIKIADTKEARGFKTRRLVCKPTVIYLGNGVFLALVVSLCRVGMRSPNLYFIATRFCGAAPIVFSKTASMPIEQSCVF